MAAAASHDAAPAGEAADKGRGWLGADWVVLPAEALPGVPDQTRPGQQRFVLLHPARGMVILDLWSMAGMPPDEEIATSLDAELALAGFLRRFDPRLPLRRIHLAQAALPHLPGVVARSYAGAPQLALPASWIDAVRSTLAVPQAPGEPAEPATPRPRQAMRYRLIAGIAALVTAGAAGLLAADGHDVAQQTRPEPIAVEASAPGATTSSAPLAVAAPESAPGEPAPFPTARPGLPDAEPPQAAASDVAPAAAQPSPAKLADPVPVAAAPAAEDPSDSPRVASPRPAGRRSRTFRRAAPSRFSQGWIPDPNGSFIQQQSQQYATGNGG